MLGLCYVIFIKYAIQFEPIAIEGHYVEHNSKPYVIPNAFKTTPSISKLLAASGVGYLCVKTKGVNLLENRTLQQAINLKAMIYHVLIWISAKHVVNTLLHWNIIDLMIHLSYMVLKGWVAHKRFRDQLRHGAPS